MIVSSYGQSFGISHDQQTGTDASNLLVGGNNLPVEKNKSDMVTISEAALSKMEQDIKNGEFVDFTSENGLYKKGLMMGFGVSTMQEWSSKGLNVSDEAVITAGKAFQDGFTALVEGYGSSLAGKSSVVNKHQVVMNSQDVPDWFKQEYKNVLSVMDNKEMKAAFENGDLFFISKPPSSNVNALASYTSVAKNI